MAQIPEYREQFLFPLLYSWETDRPGLHALCIVVVAIVVESTKGLEYYCSDYFAWLRTPALEPGSFRGRVQAYVSHSPNGGAWPLIPHPAPPAATGLNEKIHHDDPVLRTKVSVRRSKTTAQKSRQEQEREKKRAESDRKSKSSYVRDQLRDQLRSSCSHRHRRLLSVRRRGCASPQRGRGGLAHSPILAAAEGR